MPAVVYPSTLPPPSEWGGQPFERRAVSSLPGNTQNRKRWLDLLQDIDVAWKYSAAEMADWRAWYEDTLLDGTLWFSKQAPGAGGFIDRVLKFRTQTVKRENLGNGNYRVSAQLQQRGISAPPMEPVVAEQWDVDSLVGDGWTLSEGGLRAAQVGAPSTAVANVRSTVRRTTGKRYAEIRWNGSDNIYGQFVRHDVGVSTVDSAGGNSVESGGGGYRRAGYIYASSVLVGAVTAIVPGDVIGIAFDLDLGRLWFSFNGTWVLGGDPATDTAPNVTGLTDVAGYFFGASAESPAGINVTLRTTNEAFLSAPPSGFTQWAQD